METFLSIEGVVLLAPEETILCSDLGLKQVLQTSGLNLPGTNSQSAIVKENDSYSCLSRSAREKKRGV